jgi:hypothetical protein
MKRIFLMATVAIALASCQQNAGKKADAVADTTTAVNPVATVPVADAAVMSFEKDSYNFGNITQGEKVYYSYKFKNTGKSPLIVLNATATCGCTVPEVPKEPVKPGDEGVIKVVFDSNGKQGMQDKVITVTSNANPTIAQLHLTGEVKELTK